MILKLPYPSIGQCLIEYPTPHQSKTDINFWSFLWILVEGVGCLHQPPLGGGYRDSLLETVREAPAIWYQRGTKVSAIDVT